MFSLLKKCFLLLIMCVVMSACVKKNETLFVAVDADHSNIHFENLIDETPEKNVMVYEYYYNGGGVTAADFNNDGKCDLYFTGNNVENKLYLNKGGLQFDDVTKKASVQGRAGWKTGVTAADVNGDGWLDIYVSYSGPVKKENLQDELYINNGGPIGGIPTFTEQAKAYGIDTPYTFSTQATFFDYDNDGDLDMFQSNHGHRYFSPFFNTRTIRNKRHPQFGNRMYRNDDSKFVEVSEQAGIHGGGLNFGLSACVSDINNDGWMDLYVTNDFEEQDYLYINSKNGSFIETTKQSTGHISKFAMGSDIADFNNDLLPDILVVDMLPQTTERQKLLKGPDEYDRYTLMVDSGFHHQNMRNTLQLNQGNDKDGIPRFSEIGQLAGVYKTDWSWSSLLCDLDNDGFKDIFITNGFLRDFTNLDFLKYTYNDASEKAHRENTILPVFELIKKMPSTTLANVAFKNSGNLMFSDNTKRWGLDKPSMSFGAVYVDLDNDGDLELVTNNTNEKATIWNNRSNEELANNYIKVKLKGSGKNRFAIGAKVYVESKNTKQVQELIPTRGFQSSTDYVLNFGLGKESAPIKITVIWPDKKVSILKGAKVNSLVVLDQLQALVDTTMNSFNDDNTKLFVEYTSSSGISYKHVENNFVDFKSERLLPYQLSKAGPFLSQGDVNGDGLEDFFIGGASGQTGKIFLQMKDHTFKENIQRAFNDDSMCEDVGSVLFDADNDKDLDLYVVSGGNEFELGSASLRDRLYLNDGNGNFLKDSNAIPQEHSSGSCVRASDYDKDGDLDLYVGGRIDPGRFPVPGFGGILRNDSNVKNGVVKFSLATNEVNKDLKSIGIITDATWTDFNNDQWPDLVLVGEWMPVRMFKNQKGVLQEISNKGIQDSHGLWSKIHTNDFDNDGDVDFILGNAGVNLPWHADAQNPMTMYASDFDDDGKIDPIICLQEAGKDFPIATRDELLEQIPSLKKKFLFYRDYATADIATIFSETQLTKAKKLKVHTLQTSYLENIGDDNFVLSTLPIEAQFSRVSGVLSDDFDADGYKDVLITGNFFPNRVQHGRSDASMGLFLKGDGQGNFLPVSGRQCGLHTPGDVRDMISIKTANCKLVILGKNDDAVQVLKVKQP